MLGALKCLLVAVLLSGGLVCPTPALMADGSGGCGHDGAGQSSLQSVAETLPCCLDSHRADTPVVQASPSSPAASAVPPVILPDSDDVLPAVGCPVEKLKYRDKFEEGNSGKRE